MKLLVDAVATWRLASLMVYEDGPFEVFTHLRSVRALSGITSCFWCASVWAGFAVVAMPLPLRGLVRALALSGLAIGVQRVLSADED